MEGLRALLALSGRLPPRWRTCCPEVKPPDDGENGPNHLQKHGSTSTTKANQRTGHRKVQMLNFHQLIFTKTKNEKKIRKNGTSTRVLSSDPRAPRSTAFSVFCTRSNTSTACARVQANLNSAVYSLYAHTNLEFKTEPCTPGTNPVQADDAEKRQK